MGSLELAMPRQRPTRKAATQAALALKKDAHDLDSDQDSDAENVHVKQETLDEDKRNGDEDYNAFAQIMSNRSRTMSSTMAISSKAAATTAARRKRPASSPSLSSSAALSNTEDVKSNSLLIPDLEDLVIDAKRTRLALRRKHPKSYHRFTSETSRKRVQEDVLAWYDVHHRKLPWRRDFLTPSTPKTEAAETESITMESYEKAHPGQRAYEVWVSEIMCQQTQVATVIPYYNTWMTKWPTIAALAAADLEDVNKVWTGLGYYSRASRLHSGAQKVVKEFNGVLPRDPAALEKEVPGIGRYTAGAIVSHAYNVPAELVDGNVIRVLSRLRAIGGDVKSPKVIDLHWQVAKELVHQGRPGCFNQGLMELGARVCTPQNPRCGECPVQTSCRAYAETVDLKRSRKEAMGAAEKRSIKLEEDENNDDEDDDEDECTLCLPETEVEGKDQGLVTQYPRKAVKKAPRDEECAVSILERIRDSTSEYLLVKRPDKGLLAGMWEFPTVEQDQLPVSPSTYQQRSEASQKYLTETLNQNWIKDDDTKDKNKRLDIQRRDLGSVQHLFSHIRKVYHVEWVLVKNLDDQDTNKGNMVTTKTSRLEIQWLTAEELATAAIPTGISKTYQLLQKYKTGAAAAADEKNSSGCKRKKAAASANGSEGIKKVKKDEKGLADISKFFKAPPSSK